MSADSLLKFVLAVVAAWVITTLLDRTLKHLGIEQRLLISLSRLFRYENWIGIGFLIFLTMVLTAAVFVPMVT